MMGVILLMFFSDGNLFVDGAFIINEYYIDENISKIKLINVNDDEFIGKVNLIDSMMSSLSMN